MSFVLTTPGGGGAVSGINTINGIPVPAGLTTEIDFIECSIYRGAKWIVTLTDPTAGTCMQQTISVHVAQDCSAAFHDQYSLVFSGAPLPHTVDAVIAGSPPGASLRVSNTSINDYIADFTRIDLFE